MSDTENKEAVTADPEPMDTETKKDEEPAQAEEVKQPEIDEGGAGDGPAKEEEEKPNTNGKGSDSEDEPDKAEDKKESDAEGSGDDEGEESEHEEEELKPGLLEQPLVRSGKREKKKVERLTMSSPASEKKKNEIQEGSGTKLGDIPRVEHELAKTLADSLKIVHRICFNRPGSSHEVKRNLRQFSGFPFSKGSPEYERKSQAITKMNLNQIKLVCTVLDVEKKGLRDEIVERLMDFLMTPTSSGKKVPQKRKRASSGKAGKSTTGKRGRKPGSKNKSPKKKKEKSKEDVDSDGDESEDEDEASAEESDEDKDDEGEDSDEKEESEEEEEKKPPKKKAKKEEKPKKEAKKESPKKAAKTPAKEAKEPKKEKKRKSEDEKAEAKKAKKPPNDDELKEVIRKILEGANLEEVTMKTLCKQVYAKYPDFDLTDKKDFIKSTVKQIIR